MPARPRQVLFKSGMSGDLAHRRAAGAHALEYLL